MQKFKKAVIKTVIGILCILTVTVYVTPLCSALSVSAQSAVLICADTHEVLYEKDSGKRLSMASTTKIMTALLLIEQNTPEKTVKVTDRMVAVEGTSMGLLPGDSVTYRALVCGMLLSSGNDAALTSAVCVSGSEEKFSRLMNERAKEIGMKNTNFVTASGLDSEEHYSTAYDMALLGAEAIRDPRFKSICRSEHITLMYGNPPYRRTLSNHNRLLSKYGYTVGIKTGFTKKSGRCLVSAAEKDGITLVAVTLNDPDDWNDHIAMYEYGFSVMKKSELPSATDGIRIPVTGGEKSFVGIRTAQTPLTFESLFSEKAPAECEVLVKPFLYAPVREGEVVGRAVYSENGETVFTADIVSDGGVAVKKLPSIKEAKTEKSFLQHTADKIKEFINKWHSR